MFSYILRRLLLMVPTTLAVALVVFGIFHLAPGDPATVMIGMGGGGEMGGDTDFEARIEKFERKHGLDRSVVVQFLDYVGPFNLQRDGHRWFTSPYRERKVTEVELEDGGVAIEGEPLKIDYPVDTPDDVRAAADAAVATLTDEDAGEVAWDEATDQLAGLGEGALPGLLSGLFRRMSRLDDTPPIERLSAALERVTGRDPAADRERGTNSLLRGWFGWYYAEGGGSRVRNTGEKPWGGLLLGDLGKEMQSNKSVAAELWARLKVTVPLSLISVLLSYLIAIPLGIFSARRQGHVADGVSTVFVFILFSIPTFWAGLMLIILFGRTGPEWLPNMPVIGLRSIDYASLDGWGKFKDLALHSILPIATLTYGGFAYLSRQMRGGLLDVIRADYIRTARAKGLAENVVVYKHALRNSLIPVITLFASILPILIGGSIIVESVFDIPGMGKYAFEGLLRRDFYIIMATTIFVGVMTQLGILISDIVYSLVDPRIRYD